MSNSVLNEVNEEAVKAEADAYAEFLIKGAEELERTRVEDAEK